VAIHSREGNGTAVAIPDVLSSDKDWSYACQKCTEQTHSRIRENEIPPERIQPKKSDTGL
jgi:hypothetical protein